MPITSSFGYTNKDVSANKVTPVDLKIMGDYALREDEPTRCGLINVTTPIDQAELISYQNRDIKSVSTDLEILHPGKVTAGIQYSVMVQELLSTTATEDPTFRVDDPIVMTLQVRHTKSGYVTDQHIAEVLSRLLGSLQKEDGSWRFNDLMRSALKPTVD